MGRGRILRKLQSSWVMAALKILQDVARRFDDVDAVASRLVEMYQNLGRIAEAEGVVWQIYSKEGKPDRRLAWARRLAQLATEADRSAGVSPGRGQGGRVGELIEKFTVRQRSNRRSLVPLRTLAEIYKTVNNSKERR